MKLPEGTALDGEILPFRAGAILPFSELQRRIGRKTLSDYLTSHGMADQSVEDLAVK